MWLDQRWLRVCSD